MEYKLKDCLEKVIDNRGKNPKYYNKEKYPVIDNVYIKNNFYINLKEIDRYIDENTFNNFLRGYLEKNMPVMTLVGSGIGNVALVSDEKFAIVQNTIGFRVKKEILDSVYLYYWFLIKQEELKNFNRGSGQPSIKKTDIENMTINLPDIKTQKKISKILYGIDKKIQLNYQINDNLLELGDAIYEQYFENKKELPNGWKICKLKDIADNYDSKRKPMSGRERKEHQGKYPYYGATSIIDYVEDYIFDGIYLLMGEDGTVSTNDGKPVLQYIWGKNWVNNHAHVLKGNKVSTEHLMFCLRNCNITDIITGAVQPKINQENMNNIKIILADEETNKKFEKIINSIMKQYKNNVEENKRLEQIRDILLPQLMNGEIELDKIEN